MISSKFSVKQELSPGLGERAGIASWRKWIREMAKRGLGWAGRHASLATLRESSPVKTGDSENVPEVLRVYRDLPEALTDRMVLEGAGIECYLFDENMVRLDWLWSNLLGGLKLVVRKKDLEESERLLGPHVPEKFDLEGAGPYEQPRCPQCGSLEVSFEGLMKQVAGAGLLLGVPITVKRKGWNCNVCEHQWGIEDSSKSGEEDAKPL